MQCLTAVTLKRGYVADDGNRPHRPSEGQGFDEDYSDPLLDSPKLSVDPTKVDPVDSHALTDTLDQRNTDLEDVDIEKLLDVALSYMQIDRFEGATGAFERVVRYVGDGDNIAQEAWVNKGAAYGQLEEWDEAVGSCREVLKFDDDSKHVATAYTNLVYALWEAGQAADALDHAERAAELDPRFPQAWYNRDLFLHERGLSEDAANAFSNAIRFGMHTSGVHEEKACVLEEFGCDEKVEQAQQQADDLREQVEAGLVEEYQMLLRERETPEGLLASVCDPDCIGETYIGGGVSLDVTEDFYGGGKAETVDEDVVVDSLTRAIVANIVGEESVSVAVDVGPVNEETVLEVDGALHAQLLWLR